jgi:hypothetical protein
VNEITAREIPNKAYRSDAELRDAVTHADIITLCGEVAKSSPVATNISALLP